jgi:hypothetical protein
MAWVFEKVSTISSNLENPADFRDFFLQHLLNYGILIKVANDYQKVHLLIVVSVDEIFIIGLSTKKQGVLRPVREYCASRRGNPGIGATRLIPREAYTADRTYPA